MQENLGWLRKTLTGCLFIMIGIVLCGVITVAGIDVACKSDIENKLPLYPQGVVVSEESGFLRPRGMGRSTIVMTTSDSAKDVRKWYSDYRLELEKQAYDEATGRRNVPQGLANVSFTVDEDAETGQTLVYLMSDCAYN
jgi:hypothetical protein